MTLHVSYFTFEYIRCSEYNITSNILLHINDTTVTMAQYGHREDTRYEKVNLSAISYCSKLREFRKNVVSDLISGSV